MGRGRDRFRHRKKRMKQPPKPDTDPEKPKTKHFTPQKKAKKANRRQENKGSGEADRFKDLIETKEERPVVKPIEQPPAKDVAPSIPERDLPEERSVKTSETEPWKKGVLYEVREEGEKFVLVRTDLSTGKEKVMNRGSEERIRRKASWWVEFEQGTEIFTKGGKRYRIIEREDISAFELQTYNRLLEKWEYVTVALRGRLKETVETQLRIDSVKVRRKRIIPVNTRDFMIGLGICIGLVAMCSGMVYGVAQKAEQQRNAADASLDAQVQDAGQPDASVALTKNE